MIDASVPRVVITSGSRGISISVPVSAASARSSAASNCDVCVTCSAA
ncbi:Uncharacterised protein [Mycobacterium tuberculosis]|nr:Uncharacterised protein [Mycobacterium tuberculosis]